MILTRKNLLHSLALVILLLVAVHLSALAYDLYWRISWLDHVTHALGGAFTALFILWVFFFSGYFRFSRPSRGVTLFLYMVAGTLLVGVAWEIYENLLGLTWSPKGYWLDTGLDMVYDTVGALAAYFAIRNRL